MGCGSSKDALPVENSNQDKQQDDGSENNKNNKRKSKPKISEKIEFSEDPEMQGEKYHMQENNEEGEKDSFDDI